ncbi:MAG: SPOR domain-containing protein [Rhodocyclaceae bacterium]|nr:MAG: SPOR domain-containing protein [Rhodocyclaceae bacterium]
MGKFGKLNRNGDKTPDKAPRAASSTRGPKKNSSGGTLLGVFIGLVIGMLIAFGVVWYLNKSPLPFQNKYEGAPATGKEQPATPGSTATPAPLPGKPGDKAVDRQRFEFYGILEGNKQPSTPGTPVPTTATPGVTMAPAVDAKPAPSEIFFLQVGAFQKAADADNLKAKLALTGLEASVQEVSVPEKGSMHRVRVGPFRDPEEMNRARTLLSQSGVQGTVIKQKE